MSPEGATLLVGGGTIGLAVLAGLFKAAPNVYGFFKSMNGAFVELNGKPPRYDRSDTLVEEGKPSIGAQIAHLTGNVAHLADIVADQGAQNSRLDAIELKQGEHGRRIERLESHSQVERITRNVADAKVVDAIDRAHERATRVRDSIDEPDATE